MKLLRLSFTLVALALASACSTIPNVRNEISGMLEERTPQERMSRALELLDNGEAEDAKAELEALLAAQPGDLTAARLLEQIDADPRVMLGERSRPYTVREGETMSVLAERFLGDPLLFYALTRYNDIAAPNSITPGQSLRIPDRRRATAPIPASASNTPSARPAAPVIAARPAADPARASQLRLAGLEQLNRGAIDRAVVLLRQAQALDQDNETIGRDLERALRIQASLRGRS